MSWLSKTLLCLFLMLGHAPSGAAQSSANAPNRMELSGTTMGTVSWSVITFATADRESQIREAIESALDLVNHRMSTYRPDSEVSRFNSSIDTDWFAVSKQTASVVARAREISEASGGAFDVSVGPLVNLWKFGPDKSAFVIPAAETIASIRQLTGYQMLQVRLDPPALRKSIPQLQIDLSAIAKGYAVDLVCENLGRLQLDNFLVEVGGEVRAAGEKPDDSPWSVGVEKPVAEIRSLWSVVELHDKSMASSGDYRNFYVVDGQRYSHTIDPRTGSPVMGGPAAVSVIADDCMTADAVATAIMVLGKQDGLNLAQNLGLEVLILLPATSNDALQAVSTSNWPANTLDQSDAGQIVEVSLIRTIGIASLFFLVAVLAMSVGVIFGRQRIKGSCGGIAALDNPDIEPECSLCSVAGKQCSELKRALEKRRNDGFQT